MVFGRKQEAFGRWDGAAEASKATSASVDGQFRQVTDMTWDAAGNTYISDGYINSRVAKVDKNGKWLKSFGEPGDKLGSSILRTALRRMRRGIFMWRIAGNRRIQVFDGEGKFLRQITIDVPFDYANASPAIGRKPAQDATGTMAPGAPWAVCITPGPNQVLYASDSFPGRIYKLSLDGQVLGVLGESGKQLKQFGWDPRDCVSIGECVVCCGAAELACAETRIASEEMKIGSAQEFCSEANPMSTAPSEQYVQGPGERVRVGLLSVDSIASAGIGDDSCGEV